MCGKPTQNCGKWFFPNYRSPQSAYCKKWPRNFAFKLRASSHYKDSHFGHSSKFAGGFFCHALWVSLTLFICGFMQKHGRQGSNFSDFVRYFFQFSAYSIQNMLEKTILVWALYCSSPDDRLWEWSPIPIPINNVFSLQVMVVVVVVVTEKGEGETGKLHCRSFSSSE